MIHDMLAEHPRATPDRTKSLAGTISAALECVAVCSTCADACVSEGDASLERCIRLNLDCADVSGTAARALARVGSSPANPLVQGIVEICRQACLACADECDRHAARMKHCEIAARVCRQCADACDQLESVRPLMTH